MKGGTKGGKTPKISKIHTGSKTKKQAKKLPAGAGVSIPVN